MSEAQSTKVVTGKVRMSYVQVHEKNEDGKYSISLIIPKSDEKTVKAIKAAVDTAIETGKAKLADNKGKVNKATLKLPLRDGDVEREGDPAYEDCYFLNASTKTKPEIVDKDRNAIMDNDEFYSGCYGRASINFYPFNTDGNKGIAVGLNNLQKLAEGEPLSGRSRAEDDFSDDFDDEDVLF